MGKPDIVVEIRPFNFAYWKDTKLIVIQKYYHGKGENRIQVNVPQLKILYKVLKMGGDELKKQKLI